MVSLLSLVYSAIINFDNQHHDDRMVNYVLMNRKVFYIVVSYIIFVKFIGPKFMENREPYQLKTAIIIYNVAQIVLNTVIFLLGVILIFYYRPYERLDCMMPMTIGTNTAWWEIRICYMYFMLKVFDLLDTVFFVLRKSYHQISFLHFFHHICICIGSFLITRYYGGGQVIVLGLMNMFVHSVMYSYYLMSALKLDIAKQAWWKKYITQLQIIQFLLNVLHHGRALISSNCAYPKSLLLFVVMMNIIMLMLFGDFYYKSYVKQKTSSKDYKIE